MKEKWDIWNPSNLITKDSFLETIAYTNKGIFILFKSLNKEKNKIKLNFYGDVVLYRVCDEGVRLNLYEDLIDAYGKDFMAENKYFIVTNSKLIKWVERESGYLDVFDLKHFVLTNANSIFDVVAKNYPEVEIVKE